MKIIVETLAKSCLDNIFNYNMQYSSKNALEVDKNIRAQINNLNKFSYLGKLIPEMSDSHFREIIYKKSTCFPRSFPISKFKEANFFAYLCAHKNIQSPNQHIIVNNKRINIFNFCIYCWRQPVFKKKICSHHTLSKLNQSKSVFRKQNSIYQECYRQQINFLETLENTILSMEWDIIIEKNPSGFFKNLPETHLLLPNENRISWLQRYRPHVFHFLASTDEEITENNLILLLLKYLHTLEQESNDDFTSLLYREMNLAILQEPQLIWPMLLRAEVWLIVRKKKRQNWGGKRRYSFIL